MGGGLALIGEVGGQNHFLDGTVTGARQELLEAQLPGADSVQRGKAAHQHVIHAVVAVGLLQHGQIGRHLDHA